MMPLSAALPVVTVRVPVSDTGGDIANQAGHDLGCRTCQGQRRILRQRSGGHRHGIGVEAVGDRGRRRAGGDRNRIVGRIAGGHVQCAGQRTRRDIADQPAHHLGCGSDQRQNRIVGERRRIDVERDAV